jgi:Secretion system C-terminal sorting domain
MVQGVINWVLPVSFSQEPTRRKSQWSSLLIANICYPMEHPTMPIALQKKESTSKTEVLPSEVDIYPNPAKDYFTIEYHLANNNEVKGFKLYDVNGRPMLTQELKGAAGLYTVDTRNLVKGIYIYVIATLEGKTINGKITIK